MIKQLAILMLCVSATWAATFTDVTIEGTPYLTTNVIRQLELSWHSRCGKVSDLANETIDIYYNTLVNEGDYASGFSTKYIATFSMMRNSASIYWKGWIHNLPYGGFSSFTGLLHTNQVDYFIAAGLSSNGWRNATNYNPGINDWRDFDDPMYIYRGSTNDINVGDIIGPWIIDDLQMAMDYARHQVSETRDSLIQKTWSASTNGVSINYYSGGVSSSSFRQYYPDPDGVMVLAEAAFAAGAASGGDDIEVWSKLSYGGYNQTWSASLRNRTGYYVNAGGLETNSALYYFGGTANAYLYSATPTEGTARTFDSFGYNVENGKYTLADVVVIPSGIVTNSMVGTNVFGNPAIMPDWPAGISQPSDTQSGSRGFVSSQFRIIYSPAHPFTR